MDDMTKYIKRRRRTGPPRIVFAVPPDYPSDEHVFQVRGEIHPEALVGSVLYDDGRVVTPDRTFVTEKPVITPLGEAIQDVCEEAARWADELIVMWAKHHWHIMALLKAFFKARKPVTMYFPDGRRDRWDGSLEHADKVFTERFFFSREEQTWLAL